MSRKTSIFVMTIIVVLFIAIIVNDNYTKKGQTKKIFQGLQKNLKWLHITENQQK